MTDIVRREFLKAGIVAGTAFVGSTKMHLMAACGQAGQSSSPPRQEFSRLLDSWFYYTDPGYLAFVDEVQPEVVQVGFYGADFWALAHVPKAVKGTTASTQPVDGDLKASGQYLENLNKELHKRGIKVMGHCDVGYHLTGLLDSPLGPREGFFKFYNDLWDEKELGPKPVQDPLELLARKADGSPIILDDLPGYSPWPLYHGCLNNPYWRAVMKAFVRRGIQRGVDGFIANYFYTFGCVCKYCVRGFKDELRQRYSPAELRRQLGIEDLEKFRVTEILDWYLPGQMTPRRLEELRFIDISRKQAFDDIFIKYGRSLKPDLMVAQWVHSHVPPPSDSERFMLPGELWGKGEDYLWYSLGKSLDVLQLRYIRGAGGGRPFSGHFGDEQTRALMAEFTANGGIPMVRHLNFNDPELRNAIVPFFRFMKQHEDVYRDSSMAGECVLLYPRSQFQQGRYSDAVAAYEAVGTRLLDDHVLFDVLPDDMATPDKLARYKRVFTISSLGQMGAETYDGLSRFEGPPTVRVSASRPPEGGIWDIHFANDDSKELGKNPEATIHIADDSPIPVSGVKANLAAPSGFSITKIEWMTLESAGPQELSMEKAGRRVRFSTPGFSVYGVVRVHLRSE